MTRLRLPLAAGTAGVLLASLTGCGAGGAAVRAAASPTSSPATSAPATLGQAATPAPPAVRAAASPTSSPATSAPTTLGQAATPAPPAASTGTEAAPAAPTGAGQPDPAATAHDPQRCTSIGLRLAAGTETGGAGHVFVPVHLTNTGTAACALTGFPGVALVAGPSHAQVGHAAERQTGAPTPRVLLAPGRTATATVDLPNPAIRDERTCRPAAVDALRVLPPDETHPALVALPPGTTACSSDSEGVANVSPVMAGQG